jgi:hypothetical protein
MMGDGTTRRCLLSACASPEDIATGQLYPQGITLAGDSVFWTVQGTGNQNGSVYKAPRSGTGLKMIAASLDLPTGVAADATYVYWTQATSAGGKVLRCPHNESFCQAPVDIAPGAGPLAGPIDVVIGSGRVYFTNNGGGAILSCALPECGAGAPAVHASGRAGLHRLALSPSCLFWTDDTGGGSVLKVGR